MTKAVAARIHLNFNCVRLHTFVGCLASYAAGRAISVTDSSSSFVNLSRLARPRLYVGGVVAVYDGNYTASALPHKAAAKFYFFKLSTTTLSELGD